VAHGRRLTEREPSAGIRNPKRKRHDLPFETWTEIEAVADELDERYRVISIFATGTASGRRSGSRWSAPTSTGSEDRHEDSVHDPERRLHRLEKFRHRE